MNFPCAIPFHGLNEGRTSCKWCSESTELITPRDRSSLTPPRAVVLAPQLPGGAVFIPVGIEKDAYQEVADVF